MSKPSREDLRAQLERADNIDQAKGVVFNQAFTMDERLDALEYLYEVGEVEFN